MGPNEPCISWRPESHREGEILEAIWPGANVTVATCCNYVTGVGACVENA